MIKKILSRFSPSPATVDDALAVFQSTVANLKAIKAAQDKLAQEQREVVQLALVRERHADAEAVRAARAIAKIEDFVA